MISLLITVIVLGLVLWLAIWIIDLLPIPAPFGMVAKVIVGVIGLIYLLNLLVGGFPALR